MSNINKDYIVEYLRSELPLNSGILLDMEKYAHEHRVPIIQPEVANYIRVLLQMQDIKRVFELGTAIGYSSIYMATAMPNCEKIITVEKQDQLVEIARKNIDLANLSDKIEVKHGMLQEILPRIDEKFDMIFMDAAKSKYSEFLPYCLEALKPGGLLVSDNVLYRGMIATDMIVPKRQRTIVRHMREYLHDIMHREDLATTILPLGDGLAISYKL